MTARHTPMRCERFADELSAYLERDVDESTRAEMEAHALECEECGALLADLRQIRVDATELRELTPARDLWEGIAARIDAPVISISEGRAGQRGNAGGERVGPTGRALLGRRALAAAALVAAAGLGGLVTYTLMRPGQVPASASQVATAHPPAAKSNADTATSLTESHAAPVSQPVSVTVASGPLVPVSNGSASGTRSSAAESQAAAEATFDVEITRLRAIMRRRSAQLDPLTLSVIERNLKVIDEAIVQCKAALAKDPSSRFLMESLNGALTNKVELLRTAAMLPART
jgi:hypothetical protein